MYLTDEEKRILQGERGEVAQRCMVYLVEEGEVAGAERLVDIDGTCDFHVPHSAMIIHHSIPVELLQQAADRGERFAVPTFGNKMTGPGYIPDGWQDCGACHFNDPEEREQAYQRAYMDVYIRMGLVPIYSCSYYLSSSYWPTVGQHCAWNESSAIPWCNAILGGRTNIDGCFQTAFLGKVPAYDMHLDENRVATILVESERPLETDMEYDLFGWAAGEACKMDVPALVGLGKPTTTQLMKMNAALNTGGEVRMYHIPGLTPEASTVEHAFRGQKPKQTVRIDRAELRRCYDLLNYNPQEDVDFVSLGCPHLNIIDIQRIARKLEGKRCKVPMWVMTNHILYQLADELGYRKTLADAGAHLLSGACPGIVEQIPYGGRTIAVDSAKQAYYFPGLFSTDPVNVCYGSEDDCIAAALSGKWRGEFR